MATTEAASPPQLDYIRDLIIDRDTDRLTEEQRDWLENWFGQTRLNRGQASRIIDALKMLPPSHKVGTVIPTGQWAKVPTGRYAVEDPADGVLKFYKVNRPTEGKWAGYTFLDVQASDELHPIKNRRKKDDILSLILRDPQAAMLRYGIELGKCGHCGRTLTNELSREIGIGPICRAKMDW